MSVQCSCGDKRVGERQPRRQGGVERLGSKPLLTSSNSESSSSSSVPIRHSQIRSPHSSEFLQLPGGMVDRKQSQDHKPPPGQDLGAKRRPWLPPGLDLGNWAPPSHLPGVKPAWFLFAYQTQLRSFHCYTELGFRFSPIFLPIHGCPSLLIFPFWIDMKVQK